MYKIQYLPQAKSDLSEITGYIANELHAPILFSDRTGENCRSQSNPLWSDECGFTDQIIEAAPCGTTSICINTQTR